MELDIKNLQQQNAAELVKSLELVSARLIECITKASQTACSATPETQQLFNQWLELVGDRIIDAAENGIVKPGELALEIGVTPDTVISLATALHRQGKLRITSLGVSSGDGSNHDICGCLKR
ncbi:MAG: hypothetical protein Q4E34_02975 [Synergistaceae bacterium]|nr:hypothetical protein [Synergistaceae bacterium]